MLVAEGSVEETDVGRAEVAEGRVYSSTVSFLCIPAIQEPMPMTIRMMISRRAQITAIPLELILTLVDLPLFMYDIVPYVYVISNIFN